MMERIKAAITEARIGPFSHQDATAVREAFEAEATPELKALAAKFAEIAQTPVSPLTMIQAVACLDYKTNTELVFLLEDIA